MFDLTNQRYYAFLLRIWQPGQDADWRIMLEAIPSRERFGFSDLAELAAFLEEQQEAVGREQ